MTVLGILGRLLYALMLLAALALVSVKYALGWALRPAAERWLTQASNDLTEFLGVPVVMTFGELALEFGLQGLYVEVTEPALTIGDSVFLAGSASFSHYGQASLPVVVIRDASLELIQQEDGSLLIGNLALPAMDPSRAGRMPAGLPVNLIVSNTQLALRTAAGQEYHLRDARLALHPAAETGLLELSFTSPSGTGLVGITGRVDIDPATGTATGFIRVEDAGGLVRQFLPAVTGIGPVPAMAWASYDGTAVAATLRTHTRDLAVTLATAPAAPGPVAGTVAVSTDLVTASVAPPPPATHRASVASLTLLASLAQPWTAASGGMVRLDWRLAATSVTADPGEPVLGTGLTVDVATAAGQAEIGAGGHWRLAVPSLRFTGSLATGELAVHAGQEAGGSLDIELRATAPLVDYALLTRTLPLAMSEQGTRFLRDDLRMGHAQATTIVLHGGDFSTFPWPGRTGGTFLLQMDFFDARLDYADDYPPLVAADGNMVVDGGALAVTVARGSTGPALVQAARAGVDDLNAPSSTLFVALGADLPDGALFDLLRAVPDTRAAAQRELGDLRLHGGQRLDMALVISYDTDDPPVLNGVVRPRPGNRLTYLPLTVDLDNLQGEFEFDRDGVAGIAYADMLGTNARVSMVVRDGTPVLEFVAGMDLTMAMASLGITAALPLAGRSQVRAVVFGSDVFIDTNLVGTAVDLPPPLGKAAGDRRPLAVHVSETESRISYGGDLLRLVTGPDLGLAVAINQADPPQPRREPGTAITGFVPNIDLDGLLDVEGDGEFPLDQPVEIDLQFPASRLLALDHPTLALRATVAASVTIAIFDTQVMAGAVVLDGDTIAISLSHLHLPAEDDDPPPAAGTIYVEPGTLNPAWPTLRLVIDELRDGERTYTDVRASGQPKAGTWELAELRARTAGVEEIIIRGTSNSAGEPYTEIGLIATISNLETFIKAFSDGDSISAGVAEIGGRLSWRGALLDPHYLSLDGALEIMARDFVLNQDSSSVKLLNLLSPFTLLETLEDTPTEGFRLGEAKGQFDFGDGSLRIKRLEMFGPEINISFSGSTNLITERNDIATRVRINRADNITTAAVATANPIAGALLLLFDEVLDAPLLGDLVVNYQITGTWDEPVVANTIGNQAVQDDDGG